jgi:hypothetical protein
MLGSGVRTLSRCPARKIHPLRRTSISLAALALAACSLPPLNRDALVAAQPAAQTVCSTLDIAKASARLKEAWVQCFSEAPRDDARSVLFGRPNPRPYVTGGRDGRLITLSAKLPPPELLLVSREPRLLLIAEFRQTAQCNTEITARGWNDFWQLRAAHTAVWLETPHDRHSTLSCN